MATPLDCAGYKAEFRRIQGVLNLQLPYSEGTASEKHSPYIVLNGTVGKVVVGKGAATGVAADGVHPMEDNPEFIHYIESIWVEDQLGNLLSMRHLSPAEPSPATMIFEIPPGTTAVRAFEFCNVHGLFRGPAVSVDTQHIKPDANIGCSVQTCAEGTSVSACQAFTGELLRRADNTPKNDPTGKHKPYLTLQGTRATIVVGIGATPGNAGGLIHPMQPSDDQDIVHWISHIYALDDLGNLVALCELLPTDSAPATCSFEVPEGVLFLRPFEFCNKHGLYAGEIVQVGAANATAERKCRKRECSASQPSLGPYESEAVQALIQSQQESVDRISSVNMCRQHSAKYFIAKSALTEELQGLVDGLTRQGATDSDVADRLAIFPDLFARLNALGGRWSAMGVVLQHTVIDANGTNPELRLELISESEMLFSQSSLPAGQQTFADGMSVPITDSVDLLIIQASFGMDWGHANLKSLGPHYTIFYSPDFTNEFVNVTLCAKTQGWMGIGWLSPTHSGVLMNHTDMVVAFVQDGQAVVQDRFARYIEEPLRDELLSDQRSDDLGNSLNGQNDLELIPGALGTAGKEWCPDLQCNTGFSLVQFRRAFNTDDASDLRLPVKSAKIGLIHAFSTKDPIDGILVQHVSSSTGYVDLQWNLDCIPGTYFEITNIECKPCDKGQFRPASSPVWKCLQAPLGSFQNETGQAAVKRCKDGFTTASAGSTEEFACVCPGPSLNAPNGRYHVHRCGTAPLVDELGDATPCARLGDCLECPEGMTCKGSRDLRLDHPPAAKRRVEEFCSSYAFADTAVCTSRAFCEAHLDDPDCEHARPELKPGFWSDPTEPLSVFVCKNDVQCLGGVPGSVCATNREGVSCGLCKPNHFADGLGECAECQGFDAVPGAIGFIALLIAIALLGWRTRQRISKSSKQAVSAAIIATQVMIQTLGVFSDLTLVWENPVRSLLGVMQLINLDFNIVKIQCYVQVDNPAMNVLAMVLLIPALAVGGALVAAVMSRVKGDQFSWPRYLNVVGLVFLFLYLSICMSLTRPVHCKRNPNGLQTMVSSPAVVCWVPDHMFLATLAITGLVLYGAGFLAYVAQIVWRYPALVNSGHGMKLLVQYHFLFNRFNGNGYYWGLYFIMQKVFVALVPILFPNSAAVQILLLAAFIMLYLVSVTYVTPWVTGLANFADIFLNAGLLFFLLIASFLVDGNDAYTRAIIGVVLMIVILVISLVLTALVLRVMYTKLFPGKMYDMFLCHHKAGAGVLCRWLKGEILQQTRKRAKLFLDSDELEGLADIGDIVKSQSSTLVIVATKMVLSRPWCAVEICSGVANQVSIVILKCPDFDFYDEEGFCTLREGWSNSDLMIFAQNAIDPQVIEQSYRLLPSQPLVDFNAFAPVSEQAIAVAELLHHSSLGGQAGSKEVEDLAPEIIVLGSLTSAEGRLTCQVLQGMLVERLRRPMIFACKPEQLQDAVVSAQYMLVVLTNGLLQDKCFLEMLCMVEQVEPKLEIVTALADQAFEFPTAAYFEQLDAELVQSVKRVVNILALPFSPQVSIAVMSAQVDELTRRFKFQTSMTRVTTMSTTAGNSASLGERLPSISDSAESDDKVVYSFDM